MPIQVLSELTIYPIDIYSLHREQKHNCEQSILTIFLQKEYCIGKYLNNSPNAPTSYCL